MRRKRRHIAMTVVAIVMTVVQLLSGQRGKKTETTMAAAVINNVIASGEQWYDDQGNNVQGHGGNILNYNGMYYWVGEYKQNSKFSGIALYSSDDLSNWKFEKMILTPDTPVPDELGYTYTSDMIPSDTLNKCTIERPKIIFNGSDFIVWAHWENGSNYTQSKLLVAKCGIINGDYEVVNWFNPQTTEKDENGNLIYSTNRSLDMTIYNDTMTDENGNTINQAYLISACGHNMCLYKLTANCQDVIPEESYMFWESKGREAPAMVRVGDYYVLISSGQSGWLPNQAMYGYTADIENPTGWTDPQYYFGNNSTFYSQPTNIAVIKDTSGNNQYIYMGDRWDTSSLGTSTYVWLPLNITLDSSAEQEVKLDMEYIPEWFLDVSTGLITSPNNTLVSVGKKVNVDGRIAATGHEMSLITDGIADKSNYCSFTNNATPYTVSMDLKKEYNLQYMNLSTRLYGGSETCYKYIVEGSTDGLSWKTILDESDNTVVGFRSRGLSGTYRFIRMTVNKIVNVNNNSSAAWANGIVEWEVYAKLPVNTIIKPDTVVTYTGVIPQLPTKVLTTDAKGNATYEEVKWNNITSEMLSVPYERISISGEVGNTGKSVSVDIEVIPSDLLYFIDCGTKNGTSMGAHDAIANSGLCPSLLNPQTGNQTYRSGLTWGRSVGLVLLNPMSDDKFTSAAGGNGRVRQYYITLDKGIYNLTVSGYDMNAEGNICRGVVATTANTEASISGGNITASNGVSTTKTLTVTADNTLIQLDLTGINGTCPGISFLGVAKQAEQ